MKLSIIQKGKILTEEHKINISYPLKGRATPNLGIPPTDETIIKMNRKRFCLGNNEVWFVVFLNVGTGETKKFLSYSKLSKYLNIGDTTISKYVKNKKLFQKKYLFYIQIDTIKQQ